MEQRLRGDASDVEAHAAQRRIPLHQHGAQTQIGGTERGGVAARTRAQDHDLRLDVHGPNRRRSRGRRRCFRDERFAAARFLGAGVRLCHALRCRSRVGRECHEKRTFRHRVPHRDLHGLDGSRVRRGDVHRRLVALEGDEGGLDLHPVAGSDEHLDDGNAAEVADVGYGNRQWIGHARGPWRLDGRTCLSFPPAAPACRRPAGLRAIITITTAAGYSSRRRTSPSRRARCARKRAACAPSTTR